MKIFDLYKTRGLKFRMSNFSRLPIELESGIWGVTGYPILKEGEGVIGIQKSNELFKRRELSRREKPYDDTESHMFSHRGNIIYPDGQLEILLDFLSNQKPKDLYLYSENSDYNLLFLKLVQGALHSGLYEILGSLGYFIEDKKVKLDAFSKYIENNLDQSKWSSEVLETSKDLRDFLEENKEEIQEKISRNVFKTKNNSDINLIGINISDKFDIGYVIDSSVCVYISYNDDHMNQGVIVEPKINTEDIIGIILNASKIEEYKKRLYQIPKHPFDYLVNIHLGTLRAFIDWFKVKYPESSLTQKLFNFIQAVPESFFYVDSNSNMKDILTVEEVDFLNGAAKDFYIGIFPFKDGDSLYDCLIQFCNKYQKPLYSSDNTVLYRD